MRMPSSASLSSEAINIAITDTIINVVFYSLVLNPIRYVMFSSQDSFSGPGVDMNSPGTIMYSLLGLWKCEGDTRQSENPWTQRCRRTFFYPVHKKLRENETHVEENRSRGLWDNVDRSGGQSGCLCS